MVNEGQPINVGEQAQVRELDLSDRYVFIEAVYRRAKDHALAEAELASDFSVTSLDFRLDESNKEGILISGSNGSLMIIWGAEKDPHMRNGLPFVRFGNSDEKKLSEIRTDWHSNMVVNCSADDINSGGQGVGEWDPERIRSPEGLEACVDMVWRACKQVIS